MTREQRPGGDSASWRRIVALLCFGWTAIWLYRTILTPIYGEMQASLGIASDASIGAIASIYFFSYTGMQIPSGILVDRFGSRRVLIPGFALFAAAAFFIGSAGGLPMIYLGSLLAGIGSGAYYGAAYSLSATRIPAGNRTFSNAIINSGCAVGMALGLIGSSYLVKASGMPWNYMLYIVGAVILCALACMALFIRPSRKAVTAEGPAAAEDASQKTGLFSIRSISAYLLYFSTCYGYYMLVTWLPNFLETERGFQGVAIGMSSALVAFASVPGALFFSRQADRFRSKRTALIVTLELVAAATFALIVLAGNARLLLLGLLCYGFIGKLAVDPMLISLVTDNAPRERLGTYLTTFNFFGMSSSVLAPLITGVISDRFHSKVGGFYLAAVLIVISALFFLAVNRRRAEAVQPRRADI